MLIDTQPSPFDLRFSLLGFPVRVHPLFWIVMALLGDWTLRPPLGLPYMLLWVACGFVSILVHELGHAIMFRRFGARWVEIMLIAFGGLAAADRQPSSAWRRMVIALAGPVFGFALLFLVVASNFVYPWAMLSNPLQFTFFFLFSMNLFWNLINLLPIWPLDGGRVCREICVMLNLRNPYKTAFAISFLTAGACASVGILSLLKLLPPELAENLPYIPGTFMTIWLVMFAVESYQLWQATASVTRWDADDDTPPWKR